MFVEFRVLGRFKLPIFNAGASKRSCEWLEQLKKLKWKLNLSRDVPNET